METPDALTRRSIDLFLAELGGRFEIEEVWLYGSHAIGTAKNESDVDLALVVDDARPASSIGAEMGSASFDVLARTGQFVSPLPIARHEWRNPATHANPFLIANIRRDGLRYDR